jgi:hypothetical protein
MLQMMTWTRFMLLREGCILLQHTYWGRETGTLRLRRVKYRLDSNSDLRLHQDENATLARLLLAGGVVVEALAGLAAHAALGDEVDNVLGGSDEVVGDKTLGGLLDPAVGDVLCGVETDKVEELEGLWVLVMCITITTTSS